MMTYYISLYAFSILLLLSGWISVFRKFRNPSGFFFLWLTVSLSLWFFVYFLFFSGIGDPNILLRLSRVDFGIGLLIMYNLVLFIYYFSTKSSRLPLRQGLYIAAGLTLLFLFPAATDFVVSGLTYDAQLEVYREISWPLYSAYVGLHLLSVALFGYFSFKQLGKQNYLDKLRLRRIIVSTFLLVWSMILVLVILPAFGIWILEKEIIFMLAIYVLYILYTLRRYFTISGPGIGPVTVGLASIAASILILNIFKNVYLGSDPTVTNYWMFHDEYSILDTTIGILIYLGIFRLLQKIFLTSTYKQEFEDRIRDLHQNMSSATSVEKLDAIVTNGLKNLFKTKFCEIRVYQDAVEKAELQKYFERNPNEKVFVNDVVFIEENRTKFDADKILAEMPEDAFLAVPFFDKEHNRCIGMLFVGVNVFGDFYSTYEIDMLWEFAFGFWLHLKYIRAYQQIEDLSVNLDRRVDEKTIEYNNLINKQKEFISVISHEIKSPIANAIFQADSILDDMANDDLTPEQLNSELEMLNSQLIRTGELITTLFSVQYFDIHSVSLFRENVQISYLLDTEYEVYSRMHEHIQFINNISDEIGFAFVDRIQLQQVVSNLLNNAIKFANKEKPVILIEAYKNDDHLHIAIEDNGGGFQGADVSKLFDKYSTFGSNETIGLGMGLYLCKKIVDMHQGEIEASVSERCWWARFGIRIPVK